MSRVKNREKINCLFFSSVFFGFWAKKTSDFRPKNFKKLSKLTSACSDEQFLAWKFFQKFWTVLDFLQKTLTWFPNFYLRVQSKNSGRNNFFILLFRVFFGFWAKSFSDFWPKIFKNFSKLHSKCPEEQFVAWIFLKFWIALYFLQKPLAWFSNFYLRVQSKNSGRIIFLILLFRVFFGFWAKSFSDFWPKNFKKFSKLPSMCPEEQFVAWNLFLKIWIVLDFCRKLCNGSQTSFFVSRVKNPEEIIFLFFSSDFLRTLREKIFRFLANKLQEVVKTNFCVCRGTTFGLKFFFKNFEPFWIFCRKLCNCSQTSIFASRVKIPEDLCFSFFFSEFFRILSESFSRLLARKIQEAFKTTF